MPQGVQRDPFVDLSRVGRQVNRSVELTGAEVIDRVHSREQPSAIEHLALGSGDAPPAASVAALRPDPQTLQQHGRQHRIAIFVPLALLNPERHPLAVDIAHAQNHHFAGPQSGGIGH